MKSVESEKDDLLTKQEVMRARMAVLHEYQREVRRVRRAAEQEAVDADKEQAASSAIVMREAKLQFYRDILAIETTAKMFFQHARRTQRAKAKTIAIPMGHLVELHEEIARLRSELNRFQ